MIGLFISQRVGELQTQLEASINQLGQHLDTVIQDFTKRQQVIPAYLLLLL